MKLVILCDTGRVTANGGIILAGMNPSDFKSLSLRDRLDIIKEIKSGTSLAVCGCEPVFASEGVAQVALNNGVATVAASTGSNGGYTVVIENVASKSPAPKATVEGEDIN